MARRREVPRQPVEVTVPAELQRCVVEDWLAPDDPTFVAHLDNTTYGSGPPTLKNWIDDALVVAFGRQRRARASFELEHDVKCHASGRPVFRDEATFREALRSHERTRI